MKTPSIRTAGALAALAALALTLPGGALAEEKGKVAVRSFAAKGVDPAVAATLETSFCDALSEYYDVLCPEEVRAIITNRQQRLGLGACTSEDDCVKSIAAASDRPYVVTGELGKLGAKFIMSVTLLKADENKVLGRASESTEKIEELLDKVKVLAKKLSGKK